MKKLFLTIFILAALVSACNNNRQAKNVRSNNEGISVSSVDSVTSELIPAVDAKKSVSVNVIVIPYLQLKNSLAKDNSSEAAAAGSSLEAALGNFNKTVLTSEQKKIFEDVEGDAREHAEHISKSSGNITHQREHFDLLSKDIYDLVKLVGGGQVLYNIFCPMYNDGKGAYWLSETKEIQNPYFGKSMSDCGTVKEELK